MRFVVLAPIGFVASLAATASLFACGDDTEASPVAVPEAGAPDTSSPVVDSGGGNDSGGGADTGPTTDAGADADAAAPPNALFAHINQNLVSIDPTTGAVTTIGPTNEQWIVFAWDDTAKIARVITKPYSPVGGAASPKLGTINLCTGAISDGPAITLNAAQVRRAEGLAQDPTTGTFRITFGTEGTTATTEFLSEKNGTIDVTTGAVTLVGSHDTLQDDGDCLTFADSTLKLLDVASANNTGALYTLDKTTGAVSSPVTTGATVLRVAYDKTRDVVFTASGTGADGAATNRVIGTLNLTTGATTPLGAALGAGTYANGNFNALMSAPAPSCP